MSLRIILVRPKDPANVGACARVMQNFALDDLYLVAPQRPIDAKAYALASHAGDLLKQAVVCHDLREAVAGCTRVLGTTARPRAAAGYQVYTPREAAQHFPQDPLAIVFGPEDFGLSNDDLALCQGYIQIPTAAYASLNLAAAVQVVAYEWFVSTQTDALERPAATPAPREQLEAMYDQLLSTLRLIGYTDDNRERGVMHMFRTLFDRAELSEREVAALRGLWRQTMWAARQPAERFEVGHTGGHKD